MASEQRVRRIVESIAKVEDLKESEASTALHKFVCTGECEWYQSRDPSERFERENLPERRKEVIDRIVGDVMEEKSQKEAKKEIHTVLCHPI